MFNFMFINIFTFRLFELHIIPSSHATAKTYCVYGIVGVCICIVYYFSLHRFFCYTNLFKRSGGNLNIHLHKFHTQIGSERLKFNNLVHSRWKSACYLVTVIRIYTFSNNMNRQSYCRVQLRNNCAPCEKTAL